MLDNITNFEDAVKNNNEIKNAEIVVSKLMLYIGAKVDLILNVILADDDLSFDENTIYLIESDNFNKLLSSKCLTKLVSEEGVLEKFFTKDFVPCVDDFVTKFVYKVMEEPVKFFNEEIEKALNGSFLED